jgi:hypothetical protein
VRSGFCVEAAGLSSPSVIDTNKTGAIFMEAIPLCLLLNKTRLFSATQRRFILSQTVPLHACFIFRPVCRPSSDMSIQKPYKGRHKTNKNLTKGDIKTTKIL